MVAVLILCPFTFAGFGDPGSGLTLIRTGEESSGSCSSNALIKAVNDSEGKFL